MATLQRGTSATSGGRIFNIPTRKNPVITKTPDFKPEEIARPVQAEQAIRGADAFNLQAPKVEPMTSQEPQYSYRNTSVPQDTYNQTVANEQARADALLGNDAASQAQQAQNRAYFNNLEQQGISQQELMDITGATDALEASRIARGLTGLDAAQQALIDENLTRLSGEKQIAERQAQLMSDEERIREDVRLAYQPQVEAARRAGSQAKETALRVQGRAAQGSKSGIQQQELVERENIIQQGIAAERRLAEESRLAQARGASDDEIKAIDAEIRAARDKRVAAQDKLALRQAGLDEDAIAKAEFNTKTMLDALKAGFEYDPETDSFSAQEGRQKIDQDVSKMLGYASDEFGNQIMGADGQPLAIDKDNNIEWGSFQDRFGNTVFFDKSNPSNTTKPGGTRVYTNADGSLSSSPTSDNSNLQSLGAGDAYTRDDGSQGTLGENCVKWARKNVPNLPFGLYDKQDKIGAINMAVEQGFGSRGGVNAQAGDAILTSEGSVGHAAVVVGVDEQSGELILAESNYIPGQITEGRRISMNDPSIYGTISSTGQPQMSSVVNSNAKNEGYNPAISTQVIVEESQPDIKFDKVKVNEFNKFAEDGEIPLSVGNESEYNQFMNEYAIYQNSPQSSYLKGKDRLDATTDIRKEYNSIAKDPKKAITQINLLRTAFSKAQSDIKQGKSINAASQGVLIPFQKMLDPTSVVRESEYARSGNGQSLLQRMEGQFQQMKKGGAGVTAEGLREFAETAELFMNNYQNSLIDEAAPLLQQAKEYGLDTNQIFSPDIMKLIEGGKIDTTATQKVSVKDLASQKGFDYASAIAAGATDEEIQQYLTQ